MIEATTIPFGASSEVQLHLELYRLRPDVGAIVHARVEKLVFAAREPRAGVVCSQGSDLDRSFYNHQVTWEEGPLADESAELLKGFFRERR